MFGIGLPELGVIALVAVFFLGPERIPALAKQAGAVLRSARRFADGARDELREQLGPEYADLELRDLDPRSIVQRHIREAMHEAEQDAADAKRVADDDDEDDDLDVDELDGEPDGELDGELDGEPDGEDESLIVEAPIGARKRPAA